MIELLHRVEGDKASQLQREFARCKDLARVIKANRVPPFMSIRSEMPDRELADDLVDRYLRTFEAVFRIFHVPSFRADYEAYWADPAAARPSFVVAMQLCIAIGTTFREDVVKLRSLAVRLVCEAQIWLDSPREKSRVTMEGLQVMCLVLSARQIVGISGGDMSWVRAGGLLRQAMYCGLHRDPRHVGVVSRLGAEMRRRLWATVLELNLQSSIDAGGSPLLSLDDFDTEPPANLDDEDLVGDDKTLLAAGEERFTQTTTQIALLRSFPTRLAISRTVNNIRLRMPYDETVRLSGELTAACQALRPQLSRFPGTTDFQRRMVDMVTQRFFLALHTPRFRQSFEDPTYYFSRKACLDAALQLASLANLTTPNALETDFIRLVSSAGGPYGSIIYQATIIVGAELLTRKEERRRHGSAVALGEAELYAILEAALAWTERKLRNGETNIKGNTSHAAILAYANALDDRLDGAALEDSILEHAAARARVCYEILKEVSGEGSPAGPVDDVDWGMDADFDPFETTQMDFLHGWEYMVCFFFPLRSCMLIARSKSCLPKIARVFGSRGQDRPVLGASVRRYASSVGLTPLSVR